LDKYNEAIECLNKAIELDPSLIKAYNFKGTALINLNKKEEAYHLFNISVQLNSNLNDSISFYNKGFSLWRLIKY
jgi:tetratricopeptide (TPR) repeat protein